MNDFAQKDYLRLSYLDRECELAKQRISIIKANGWKYVQAEYTNIRETFSKYREPQK